MPLFSIPENSANNLELDEPVTFPIQENYANDFEYNTDDEEFLEELAEHALCDQFGDEAFETMMDNGANPDENHIAGKIAEIDTASEVDFYHVAKYSEAETAF